MCSKTERVSLYSAYIYTRFHMLYQRLPAFRPTRHTWQFTCRPHARAVFNNLSPQEITPGKMFVYVCVQHLGAGDQVCIQAGNTCPHTHNLWCDLACPQIGIIKDNFLHQPSWQKALDAARKISINHFQLAVNNSEAVFLRDVKK